MVDAVIRLFESNETAFLTNGIGSLFDASKCEVVEECNGSFELEMEYHVSGKRYHDLQLRRMIVAKPNPYAKPQPFRIYEISKPMNGLVTVKAQHISYDMSGYPVSPFTASGVSSVLSKLNSSSIVNCPFRFSTDLNASGEFSLQKPVSMRSLLGGSDGSILNTYGGEYEFDGFRVILHSNRGQNRGVTIRYGKNMTDLKQEENCGNVYTAVYPFWYSDEWGLVELPEKTVSAPGSYDFTHIYSLDLSGEWENSAYEWEDEYPTEDEIRELAQKFISENKIGIPAVSLTVSFEQLSQSGEYAALDLLETVCLCDMVNVEFPKLGVKESSKCIKTTNNVLTGKYISIELGETSSNLASAIVSRDAVVKKINNNINDIHNDIYEINENVDGLSISLEKTSEGLKAEVTRAKDAETMLSATIIMTAEEIMQSVSETYQSKTEAGTQYSKLQSEIKMTAQDIISTVSATYETKSAANSSYTNLYSQIAQSANSIISTVSATYETKSNAGTKYQSFQSQIEQAAYQISQKVSAGDVESLIMQKADSIRMKAAAIVIDSYYFSVDQVGRITSTGGNIAGFGISSDGFSSPTGATKIEHNIIRTGEVLPSHSGAEFILGSTTGVTTIHGNGIRMGNLRPTTAAANMTIVGGSQGGEVCVSTGSSRRWKRDIGRIIHEDIDAHKLYDAIPRQFIYKDDYLSSKDPRFRKYIPGFVIEELEKVYPIAVERDSSGKLMDWNPKIMIAPMLQLIQEQKRKMDWAESMLMSAMGQIAVLTKKMEEIKSA